MNISTIIFFVLLVAAIGLLWYQGQLTRLADYVRETREELRKCTWPSWNELKGSTVVVMISIGLLGAFTMAADGIFFYLVTWVTSALS